MSRAENYRWDDRLMCGIDTLTYDFRTRAGRIRFPPGDCCDMSGCVRLFQGIDPRVAAIDTYSGDRVDTTYRLEGREWHAYRPARETG